MKIVHCADVHLDSPLVGLNRNANSRRNEIVQSFCNTVEYASKNAQAMIVAGDLFDSANVTLSTVERVANAFATACNLTIYLLSGNHDGSIDEEIMRKMPSNVRFFGKKWTVFEQNGVVFCGIDRQKIDDRTLNGLALDSNNFNIVVLHGDFNADFNTRILQTMPIDYLALGHFHSFASVKFGRGVASYCGTNEPRGFDEGGIVGFNLIDTADGSLQHIDNSLRHVRTVSVDLTEIADNAQLLKVALPQFVDVDGKDYLNVILTGRRKDGIDTNILVDSLANKYYALRIQDDTKYSYDKQSLLSEQSLRGEFCRAVVNKGLDTATEDRVIERGLCALEEAK